MKLRNLLFSFGMILALPCMLAPQTVLSSDASEYTFTTIAGSTGGLGAVDAAGQAARFSYVGGVAVDSAGNVYVADSSNHTIRKLTPAGEVTTLAGLAGTSGSADGTGSEARFNYPQGVALDGADNLYVADVYNHTIRKITPAGVVTTIAGLAGSSGSTNGTGSSARFNGPFGVAVDGPGNIYVADCYNHLIRKISPAGEVTTLAGSAGNAGSSNGTGGNAKFYYPQGVAVDDLGNVFVADLINNAVRKITSSGVVSTFAGSASASGSANGTGTAARFYGPTGIAIDSARNLYVAEYGNNTIRKISSAKVVSTIAGKAGAAGYTDGIGTVARFDSPRGIALDQAGSLYVADSKNAIVRKITPEKVVITLAGLANASGATNGPSSTARFYQPLDVAADGGGNLYVADTYNHAIRKITPAGAVITLAGVAGASGSANGAGSAARFNMPFDLTVDGAGNVFVADTYNHAIRKITPAGVVATFAGLAGKSGSTNGTASIARFNYPTGVAIDGAGNMYVADQGNHTIRKITPAGVVTTLAGLAGKSGSTNGTGSEARFYYPQKIAVDDAGNLYVVDKYNQTIRKITPAGVVTTLAGLAGASGSTNGTGSEARFYQPSGITVDNAGNVYVADTANHTIRKITPEGVVTTISGLAGSVGSANGTGSAARFYYPSGVAVDRAGNLYVADALNNSIRKGNPALSDLPVVDQSSARAGLTRYLSVTDRTTTSQTWSVIRRPVGSSAQFSSATSANPTFIPDAPGLFIFQFSGTDAAGQVAIRTVEFQALPSAPAVAVTSHANLEQVTIPNIVLAGTVSDAGAGGEGVATVTVNGVHAHNDTAAGTGTANWSLPVSLNLGTNILAIAAKDTLMNATNFNLRIVRVDYKSPALAVTSHTPGQAVNTATLVLAGTACDAGLSESGISFVTVNGARAANDNASGANAASWSRSVKLVLGANKLAVVAADGANNKTTNNLVVYLDTTRPVVKITSPVSGRARDQQRLLPGHRHEHGQRAAGASAGEPEQNRVANRHRHQRLAV